MELLKRIDMALERSGKTRADLAREMGISVQAITSLGKRHNAKMKHENLVKAAQSLSCTVEWLASGKGPKPAIKPRTGSTMLLVDTDVALREMRASMVAAMFTDLPTDEDRQEVVAFIASKLAKMRVPA